MTLTQDIIRIPLGGGLFATIDAADANIVADFKWRAFATKRAGIYYAIAYQRGSYAKSGRSLSAFMHRVIMTPPAGMDVDHIDNDGLNNRRSNLRICTRSMNHGNRHRFTASSGFKGVYWNKVGKSFEARICVHYVRRHLGCYRSAIEAARAYDAAAIETFGEYAHVNFPDEQIKKQRKDGQP